MDGNLEAELLAWEVVIGIGVGIILQCFGETASLSAEDVGHGIFSLVDTLAMGGSSVSVTPTMGTGGGKTGTDGAVDGQGDTEERCADGVWDLVVITSMSRILAAGKPNKANSSCCTASACRSSARLHIWLTTWIFCSALVETKAVMSEWMAVHRRIRGEMPEYIRIEEREESDHTPIINGIDLSPPMGRLIPDSIIIWT